MPWVALAILQLLVAVMGQVPLVLEYDTCSIISYPSEKDAVAYADMGFSENCVYPKIAALYHGGLDMTICRISDTFSDFAEIYRNPMPKVVVTNLHAPPSFATVPYV